MRIDSILHRIARFDSAVHRETNEKRDDEEKEEWGDGEGRGGERQKGKEKETLTFFWLYTRIESAIIGALRKLAHLLIVI